MDTLLFETLADIVLIALGYIVYRELEKHLGEFYHTLMQELDEIREGLHLQSTIDERLLVRLERIEQRLMRLPLSRGKRARQDEAEPVGPANGDPATTEEATPLP